MLERLKSIFWLSREEQLTIGGILLIVLVGIVARHQHLKHQKMGAFTPPTREHAHEVITHE